MKCVPGSINQNGRWRSKRKGRQGVKEKFFEVLLGYEKDSNIDSAFSMLVKEQWDPLQHKIHQLTARLLVDGRDLKIQYHYKTTDRRICAVTFLELSDGKVSMTEGEGRIAFSNSGSMCLPSKDLSSGWARGHTANPPALWQNMSQSTRGGCKNN